jgi:hypothetical protein
MKAITVAMEVTSKGDVVREAFTMVHHSLEAAEQWQKDLPKQFKSEAYKTQWAKPRVKIADAIKARGNVLKAQSYLFG